MSVNSTDPSVLFGGTWTKIEGSFLWGTSNTPKHTGGSTTTNSHVLKVNEIPAHVHSETIQTGDGNFNPVVKNRTGGSTAYAIWPENATGGWTNVGSGEIMTTRATGGGEGHTHTYMPPYIRPLKVGDALKNGTKLYFNIPDDISERYTAYKYPPSALMPLAADPNSDVTLTLIDKFLSITYYDSNTSTRIVNITLMMEVLILVYLNHCLYGNQK